MIKFVAPGGSNNADDAIYPRLSGIERQILLAMAGGCDIEQAAEVLKISLVSVERHIIEICAKAFPTFVHLRNVICSKLLS